MMTTTMMDEAAVTAHRDRPAFMKRVASWPLALLKALRDVYRAGLSMPVAAPAVFAIALLPEAAQHVAEIQLGMFASKEAFMADAGNSTRMAFGAVKVAGLFLCIFAAARFVRFGSVRRALLLPRRDIGRTLLGFVLVIASSVPAEWAARTGQPPEVYWPMVSASWLLSFLLTVYLLGALLGDREMTLRAAMTRGWRVLPLLAILTVAAFWPAMTLHIHAHKIAIAAAPAVLWGLMAADSLIVGLLATLVGSALAVSYRAAAHNEREGAD